MKRLRSSIIQSMASYCVKSKGATLQDLVRHTLSSTNLQPESSWVETLRPKRNHGGTWKRAFNLKPASSLEKLLFALSELELGSKQPVLSEALSGATRPTTELMFASCMDSVHYCRVCLDHTTQTSKLLLINEGDASSERGMPTFAKLSGSQWVSWKLEALEAKAEHGKESSSVAPAVESELFSTIHLKFSTVW